MSKKGDMVQAGLDLAKYAMKKREPKIDVAIPQFSDLEEQLAELRSRPRTMPEIEEAHTVAVPADKVAPGTACIPCSNDHLSVCSGLLAEALRFARKDGIYSEEVTSRVGLCRDELNSMERVDLRPEVTMKLPSWEKELANEALSGSRDLRHDMAEMTTVDELENIAGEAQMLRGSIGQKWIHGRVSNMSEADKAKVVERAQELFDKER